MAPVGSQFAVKNLFFNVPARRRALDKSTTEPRHIAEEFRRVAMCHPEMSFSLYGEDAPVYTLHPSGLKQRIVGLVGKHAAGNLNRDVAGENHRFRRKAFVQQADQPRAVHVRERPVLQEPLFS